MKIGQDQVHWVSVFTIFQFSKFVHEFEIGTTLYKTRQFVYGNLPIWGDTDNIEILLLMCID